MTAPSPVFVSRAGLKLDHALREFNLDVTGFTCADFGCNAGGFTDCLLQRGAAKVHAIDTGYGMLAWKLRNDPRVIVMERTNALHAAPEKVSDTFSGVDLVVIDLAWTQQRHAIPAALKWLASGTPSPQPSPKGRGGLIISLVKPHYELDADEKRALLHDGRLDPAEAERVLVRVIERMPTWGAEVIAHTKSPLTGGKSSRSKRAEGNVEYLVLARCTARE